MLRSSTVNTIHDLLQQEKGVTEIALELHLSRTTVRKYRDHPEAVLPKPRPPRPSKLDPYKEQIQNWMTVDHCTNCEVMFARLRALGYQGGITILKDYVQPFRGAVRGKAPVKRYETKPGVQMQFDWGEFLYEEGGEQRKVYGFTAVLGYSRMRYVCFTKRCNTATLIRCIVQAFEYFGGRTHVMLTDRMKSVLLEMKEKVPHWNPKFADFAVAIGVSIRVCKAYTPQTKGKVERTVSYVKSSFWPGVTFTDLRDLNRQALKWCERINSRVHRTTHMRPVDRLSEEELAAIPAGNGWERFATEERKVSWDGYVSYDGVLYGTPSTAQVAGKRVQVRENQGKLSIWSAGQLVCQHVLAVGVPGPIAHPEQWSTVPNAAAIARPTEPLGHQIAVPQVQSRAVQEYDRYLEVATHEHAV